MYIKLFTIKNASVSIECKHEATEKLHSENRVVLVQQSVWENIVKTEGGRLQ